MSLLESGEQRYTKAIFMIIILTTQNIDTWALTHVWHWLVEFNGVVTEFFFAFSLHLFSRKFHPVKPEISSAPLFKVFCPRRADSFAGKATLTSGLLLGRSEVLRSLRHNLRAQSQGHHNINRLEPRSVERGSARRFSLKGRERTIVSLTNIVTVSKVTLGTLLRDGMERI